MLIWTVDYLSKPFGTLEDLPEPFETCQNLKNYPVKKLRFSGLRQAVMSNNHRSATVSPSSENSPSTEGDHRGHHGHAPHPRGGGGYAQYSSQDSLPDSPYSSQSLDSQPAPGQGRF